MGYFSYREPDWYNTARIMVRRGASVTEISERVGKAQGTVRALIRADIKRDEAQTERFRQRAEARQNG